MSLWPTIFWLCAALVLYTYAIYPLIVWALVRLRGPHRHESGIPPKSVSIVIAARNEETAIYRRVGELVSMIESAGVDGEVIVVSDGSTDATVTLAQRAGGARVRVLQLPASLGKAAALNAGCAASAREIVIFADARQRWATDAVSRLLANFADPRIGAVSGISCSNPPAARSLASGFTGDTKNGCAGRKAA